MNWDNLIFWHQPLPSEQEKFRRVSSQTNLHLWSSLLCCFYLSMMQKHWKTVQSPKRTRRTKPKKGIVQKWQQLNNPHSSCPGWGVTSSGRTNRRLMYSNNTKLLSPRLAKEKKIIFSMQKILWWQKTSSTERIVRSW